MQPPASDAVRTYRYLRLALVGLAAMLAAGLVIEWLATGAACWQPSISSYAHTPAREVFVGSLVASGVCMIVIKGVTETEDVLLNVAGMLAPVVAFVPTTDVGTCRSATWPAGDDAPAVENGVWALLLAGLVGIAVAVASRRGVDVTPDVARAHRVGLGVAGVVLVGFAAWFVLGRASFVAGAHYVAAVAMFACIVAVVLVNAKGLDQVRGGPGRMSARNRYTAIAALMVGSVVVVGGLGWWFGWDYTVLWVEALLLLGFATFWILQTRELWNHGVRPIPSSRA